jgi:pSer/pThr/pTyr-binding forkhead associated (FHA) protein
MRAASREAHDDGDTTKEYILAKLRSASPRQNLRLPSGKKLSLAVISGSDSGRNFPIEKPRVVIGRSEADIPLSDSEISRSHAAIEIEDEAVTVVDLGSTNGTFVGGSRIESCELENYGEFEVGGTTLMLIITGETI